MDTPIPTNFPEKNLLAPEIKAGEAAALSITLRMGNFNTTTRRPHGLKGKLHNPHRHPNMPISKTLMLYREASGSAAELLHPTQHGSTIFVSPNQSQSGHPFDVQYNRDVMPTFGAYKAALTEAETQTGTELGTENPGEHPQETIHVTLKKEETVIAEGDLTAQAIEALQSL